eukprot:sb/3469167/
MKYVAVLVLWCGTLTSCLLLAHANSAGADFQDMFATGLNSVRNSAQVLTEKFQEKIAKLELVGEQESWGSALLKIKSMADGEITAIYSDVFGIDLGNLNITPENQKQIALGLCGVFLLISTFLVRIFSLWTCFTLSLLMVCIKSVYGLPAMLHSVLYLGGILLVVVNYILQYPIQSMVLLMSWQLAKAIVWICSPSPASQSDVSEIESRLSAVEQRLQRAELALREFRSDFRRVSPN